MPREPSWWIWLVTALLLSAGVAGWPAGFVAAVVLSVAQSGYFLAKHRSLMAFPVQIRVAYTALLLACAMPALRWLYWLPTVGTSALILIGYCLMARILSLMPWNRDEPLGIDLVCRTFLTPPVAGNERHGLPGAGCAGGVCERERRVAKAAR